MATTHPRLSIVQSDSVICIELIVDRLQLRQVSDNETISGEINNICTDEKNTTSLTIKNSIQPVNYIGSMISLSLLVILVTDILIFCGIITIYFKAKDVVNSTQNTKVTADSCDDLLVYLTDVTNVIISGLCLISTCLFATAIQKVRLYQSRLWIVVYIISMIIHSILLHYEANIVSNIQNDTTQTTATQNCINIETNIRFIWYTLQLKTLILTIIFIVVFAHRVYIRFIMSRSMNVKRFYFGILVIIFMCLLLSTIDFYFNNGSYLHKIGILFALLYAKCHLCSASQQHGTNIDTQHLTQTYDANAVEGPCCCRAGCSIDCKSGCCEWKSAHGGESECANCGSHNCCVICGVCHGGPWCCRQADYPGSICFSCCGICTCYCCDPGGCCDVLCCSFDWFTWCCCAC